MIRVVYGSLDNENGALVAVICTTVPAKGPERLTRSISKQVSYRAIRIGAYYATVVIRNPKALRKSIVHCLQFKLRIVLVIGAIGSMESYVALLQCARTEPPKATESRSETLANKPAGMQRAIIHKDNRRRLLESAGVLIHRALYNEDATPPVT